MRLGNAESQRRRRENPEVVARELEAQRLRYALPDVRARRIAAADRRRQDPDVRAHDVTVARRRREDPGVRAQDAAVAARRREDPGVRARDAAVAALRRQDPRARIDDLAAARRRAGDADALLRRQARRVETEYQSARHACAEWLRCSPEQVPQSDLQLAVVEEPPRAVERFLVRPALSLQRQPGGAIVSLPGGPEDRMRAEREATYELLGLNLRWRRARTARHQVSRGRLCVEWRSSRWVRGHSGGGRTPLKSCRACYMYPVGFPLIPANHAHDCFFTRAPTGVDSAPPGC